MAGFEVTTEGFRGEEAEFGQRRADSPSESRSNEVNSKIIPGRSRLRGDLPQARFWTALILATFRGLMIGSG